MALTSIALGELHGPVPTPTQVRVAEELFARTTPRPQFDPALGSDLLHLLEDGLAPLVADRQPDQPLFLAKRLLAQVHTCEGSVEADRATPFAWSAPAARGTVAHKAVELSITLRDSPPPLDLVDTAIDRLIESSDRSIRAWLLDAPAAEIAELRGAAADWVVKFQDTFPVLQRAWRPRLESALTVDLCGGRVVLRGKVDLALGRADGTTARVLIIDFKTGRPQPVHAEDLRFYALLETIRVGVPPYRLATFSLDSGTWVAEDVDEEVLIAALRRTIAGAAALLELDEGRTALLRAGPSCRWCPAADGCPAAIAAGEAPSD
jgi:RecB family exonuclease